MPGVADRGQPPADAELGGEARIDRGLGHERHPERGGSGAHRAAHGAVDLRLTEPGGVVAAPTGPHTTKPFLTTSCGLTPKNSGRHSTMSASLPGASEPT